MGYHQQINTYLKAGTTYLGHSSVKMDFCLKRGFIVGVPKLLHKSAHGPGITITILYYLYQPQNGFKADLFSVIKMILLLDTNH